MNRQAGFSLVEVVVGVAILVLIFAGLAGSLTTLIGHGVKGMSLTDRQQEVRSVLDMVVQDVRYSTKFVTTGSANELIFYKTSNGAEEKVRYWIGADPGDSGKRVLIRTVYKADGTTKLADNPVFDPNRYYMSSTDFAVKANYQTVSGSTTYKKVTAVDLLINLRDDGSGNNPVEAQMTVYPLNGPHVTD